MDFDPRITSDGTGYGSGHGWHCNFHYGYGQDIIDEDVENEKSCIQVLKLLIAKADAEVHQLEDELAILQCQLKWTESDIQEDPYELFCDVFKSKIDSLTSATGSLRNENELSGHHTDTTLDLQRPAERVCDIINALIRPESQELDEVDRGSSNGSRQHAPSIKSREGSEQTALVEVTTGKRTSKSDVLPHGQSMECTVRSKIGDAATSPVPAEKEVTVKVEEDDYDINFQLDAFNLLTKDQEQEREHQDHQKAFEDHSEIAQRRTRLQSGMSALLKPQGKKTRRKHLCCDGVKSEPLSDEEAPRELGPTHKAKRQVRPRNDTSSKPSKTNTPKQETSWDWESSAYDLEALRLKLSEDPSYLAKLTIPELKAISKQNKIKGYAKLKKEMIIKKLMKQLGL